ncbi:MAG: DUF302 domain-containing protein [Thermoplasmata archaeon]
MKIEFDYTVETERSFEDAVVSIRKATEGKGWSVLHVHDMKEILAVKGFDQEPLKMVEICSGKYANQFLDSDRLISLCMPCKINVYVMNGKVFISGMLLGVLPQFFPDAGLEDLATQVEKDVKEIIDSAK